MDYEFDVSKEYKNLMWGFELHFSGSGYGAVVVSGHRLGYITVVCYVPLYWRLL